MAYGVERFFLLSYCLACCWPGMSTTSNMRIVRQWSELDFVFPSEEARQAAINKDYFVRGYSVPLDMDVQYRQGGLKSRIFVTIPRFDIGRPITLGLVEEDGRISPYPDYSWHDNQGSNCDGLTSVFRTAIDKCNRLWVMDTGKINERQVCPPQLLAFDLNTDRLVYRHKVNESHYIGTSLFITPVLDIRTLGDNDCSDMYVYIADVSGFSLLVVDVDTDRSWRVTHRLMYPYPSRGSFTIDGESFELMDGIFGMALSPFRPGKERFLYFHALAATTENVVRTSILRNDTFLHDPNVDASDINAFSEERPNQSAMEVIDHKGIMYFGLMDPPSVYCWNTATEFSPKNFHPIAVDQETLQFASGMKIIDNLKGQQELWVFTSSFQRVMTGSISNNRVNFRIHAEKISILLQHSPCLNAPKDHHQGHFANAISQQGPKHTWRYGIASFL